MSHSKPAGRDEIRAAILRAASKHFAAHGTAASLREIADEAHVNLGLIHRHFGNKDDLIRAVLASHADAGAGYASRAGDLVTAVQEIFRSNADSGRYIKIVAWLVLEGMPIEDFQSRFPTITALRALTQTADEEADLLAAFAMIYGWSVFGDQLLAAFGHKKRDRAGVEAQLSHSLERLLDRRDR